MGSSSRWKSIWPAIFSQPISIIHLFPGMTAIRMWSLGIPYYSGQGLHCIQKITQKRKSNSTNVYWTATAEEIPSYHLGVYRDKLSLFPKEHTKMCWTCDFLFWRLTQEQQNVLGFYTLHASFPLECNYCWELQKQHSERGTELIPSAMPFCLANHRIRHPAVSFTEMLQAWVH